MNVVIAGGGTGGHVFPALALATQLQHEHACEVLLVGSEGGLEQRLVPVHGFRLELLKVGKLMGTGVLGRARTLAGLPLALASALRLLRRFGPAVVVGVGGFASGPVVAAANLLRIPVVLLEQNSIPGVTNRVLCRLAQKVVSSFEGTAKHFPEGKTILLGNPVRPRLLALARAGRSSTDRAPRVLVLGGSQGARAVNHLLADAAPGLFEQLPGLSLVHQTGSADHGWVAARYRVAGLPARVLPFIDDMEQAYGEADLVVGRSGATTIAELCVLGLPSVLIPFPFAADDHQACNAADLVAAGGAVMERQEGLDAPRLAQILVGLLGNPRRLARMGQAAAACGFPHAAGDIANLILGIASGAQTT